ncbi:hypothetical protein [Parabacteroides bouchesdurhonensis]|nr:hypothetical protein [Parabacteroides bouchesdurhonensis]
MAVNAWTQRTEKPKAKLAAFVPAVLLLKTRRGHSPTPRVEDQ